MTKNARKRLTPAQIAQRDADDPMIRARAAAASASASSVATPPTDRPSPTTAASNTGREGSGDVVLPAHTSNTATAGATAGTTAGTTAVATPGAVTATTEHGTTPPAAQIGRTDTAAGSSTQAAEFRLLTEGDTVGDDVRRAALQAMFPEGPKHDVAAVKATVIELICQVSFTSFVSDRSMMTIGTSFARWCLHNTPDSTFRPDRDLNEDALADYLNFEKSGVTDQTRDTYASQLRRLARQGTPRRRGTRKAASAPYSSRSRDRMWTAACAIDDWVGAESRSLLSLTFGGGIRSDEVHAFKARQVTQVGRRVVLEVISGGMWVRHVPVYGQYGQWLLTRSRELRFDDYLFRPTFLADRADAISSLVPKMRARSTVFADFKAARARHTWLTQALVAGIPYNAVSQVAGIGKDSNLPSDLLVHMPHLSSDDTYRCFDAAYNRAQVA